MSFGVTLWPVTIAITLTAVLLRRYGQRQRQRCLQLRLLLMLLNRRVERDKAPAQPRTGC